MPVRRPRNTVPAEGHSLPTALVALNFIPPITLHVMDTLPPLPVIALGQYRHFKGGRYEVLGVVRSSETLEPLVLYRPLDSHIGLWVRPYAMFVEHVEVDGVSRARFERVE